MTRLHLQIILLQGAALCQLRCRVCRLRLLQIAAVLRQPAVSSSLTSGVSSQRNEVHCSAHIQEAEEARAARDTAQQQLQRATAALDESTTTLVRVTAERDAARQEAKQVMSPPRC